MISDVVSAFGSHLRCGYWQWCRMNSWCCNRISDYIAVLSSLWHEGFHLKEVVKKFRCIQHTGSSTSYRQAQCGLFCHAVFGRGGCSPQEQAAGTAPALPLFILDKTFVCSVLPFSAVEEKGGGVWEAVCSIHTLLSSSTVLPAVLDVCRD